MDSATETCKLTCANALLGSTPSLHRTLAHFPTAPASLATSFQRLLVVLKTIHSTKVSLNMPEDSGNVPKIHVWSLVNQMAKCITLKFMKN